MSHALHCSCPQCQFERAKNTEIEKLTKQLAEINGRLSDLMCIVEGCRGKRWESLGHRLVDTPEWCALYTAWNALRGTN